MRRTSLYFSYKETLCLVTLRSYAEANGFNYLRYDI